MQAHGARAQWLYETTGPGSGLPVLTTLKDMVQSGDKVHSVRGVFSGSITYLLNAVERGTKLSDAVRAAAREGLTEPDPRDDLTGLDVCRKVVVLARELGLAIELDDVHVDSLLPPELDGWTPDGAAGAPPVGEQLADALVPYDDAMAAKIGALLDHEGARRSAVQLCSVDVQTGRASVSIVSLDPAVDRVATCEANENLVEITTERYSPRPMVLQGPGAGAQITASGLFADLLHLSRTLVEWNIPQIL